MTPYNAFKGKRTKQPKLNTLFSTVVIYGVLDASTGEAAFDYDTFVSVKHTHRMKVSDFAVERGAFATYNKATHAYTAHVQLAVTDNHDRRNALMVMLDAAMKSTSKFNIVTQDYTLLNATISGYDTAHVKERGWGKIIVDVEFIEVREVTPQYTNARSAGGRSAKSNGLVSTANPVWDPTIKEGDRATVVERAYTALGVQSLSPNGTGVKALNTSASATPPSAVHDPATAPLNNGYSGPRPSLQ